MRGGACREVQLHPGSLVRNVKQRVSRDAAIRRLGRPVLSLAFRTVDSTSEGGRGLRHGRQRRIGEE